MKTRIKELRQENNFTQKFLAHKIGATQAALSKIESGTSIPDAHLLIKLSDIFEVSIDYILCLSEHRTTKDISSPGTTPNMKIYQACHSSLSKFNSDQFLHLLNFVDSMFEL